MEAAWLGPEERFEHNLPTRIARYAQCDDGQPVELRCTACPARFYTLNVLPSRNTVGERRRGYVLETASGMLQEAVKLAQLIADGSLVLARIKRDPNPGRQLDLLWQEIHDEADHALGTEAELPLEVMRQNLRHIRQLSKKVLEATVPRLKGYKSLRKVF